MRAPDSAGSSGPEGGAAASARAALYPGEEAPRRHPVTPGLAGPSGLPLRHSLSPARRPTIATDLPADRHQYTQLASERASERPLPPLTGQQQAPARPGPTPLNGRLQPPRSRTRRAIGNVTRRSVLSSTPIGCGAYPSLFSPPEPGFLPGAHWVQPLASSAPSGCPCSQEGLVDLAASTGPGYSASDGATSRRVLGAASSSRQAGG